MLHANPLLRDISCDKKFITVGEIMLRLTPPNYEKLRMANNFEASYGGSEANIALALANLASTARSSRLCRITRWASRQCVCCAPTMCTARR